MKLCCFNYLIVLSLVYNFFFSELIKENIFSKNTINFEN